MIPASDEHGYLPPGVHPATLDEIAERFGQESELRRVEMESIRWLVDLARRAGVSRIILNGSFTTGELEPNDVDCVLLTEPGYPMDAAADRELNIGLPFIEMHLVEQSDFNYFVGRVYATDRDLVPKGMIEIVP